MYPTFRSQTTQSCQTLDPGEFLPLRAYFAHNRRMNYFCAPEDGEGLVNARETIIRVPSYLFV